MTEYERLLKVCREGHNAYLKDQNPIEDMLNKLKGGEG